MEKKEFLIGEKKEYQKPVMEEMVIEAEKRLMSVGTSEEEAADEIGCD